MPIIKSALKKVRKDEKRTAKNARTKHNLKGLVKKMRKNPLQKTLQEVTSALDKAAKTNLIHPNKASRMKSKLSKLITRQPAT